MTRDRYLLTHADHDAMRAAFKAHTEGQSHFTRRMAIAIADQFGMAPLQAVRHYERCGLLKRGSVEWFRINGGITRDHIEEARAARAADEAKALSGSADRGSDPEGHKKVSP